MKRIIFENSGEIDLRVITTFGCSVKETSNPIGYFGTGLKYAIAVLLRTGHKIWIQSGTDEFSITSRNSSIRGKEFEFVYMDETPTGFTTELGKNWEVWAAYRELACNAKDEECGKTYEADVTPVAQSGITRVSVEGAAICVAHNSRRDFILEGEPSFKIGTLEVFDRPSQGFFYRGIKVMNFQQQALYTYNQTGHVELTEDRTAKGYHEVVFGVAREILKYGERPFLERILVCPNDSAEAEFDFNGWSDTPSADFLPTVSKLQRNSLLKINRTALALWRAKGNGIVDPRRINPTKIQLSTLENAIEFCEKSGFMLRDEYPILIVETLGEGGTLAAADQIGKQIFLTERIFQTGGTKGVARALIEEYLHLKFKFTDCSREMQNYLFDKMVSLAEELTGNPL